MINSSYNFGLLLNDTSNSSSINNLKSFTVNFNNNTGLWEVSNTLKDYFVEYYNKVQSSNGPGNETYSGLMVYNNKGNNFIILCINQYQSLITQANFVAFSAPGTIPNINNFNATFSITYPELPTFINGFNGYNIPKGVLNEIGESCTFYIID